MRRSRCIFGGILRPLRVSSRTARSSHGSGHAVQYSDRCWTRCSSFDVPIAVATSTFARRTTVISATAASCVDAEVVIVRSVQLDDVIVVVRRDDSITGTE